ncbi:MAG: hypothetical protein OXF79_29970 [Chloroflexi bacterium]|nr:hypothetical protein [Chloroflexota bacterium]
MMLRPDQIAARLEAWIETEIGNTSPEDVAAALDIVRQRATMRSVPSPAAGSSIGPDDIRLVQGEPLGPVTRRQLFDAVQAWELNGSPAGSLWHYTPDYAIQVRHEAPAAGRGPHYVHITAYHQDVRAGQERPEDALIQAMVHWGGPASA